MVFSSSVLKEKYKDYSNPLNKIKRDVDSGILIRLNRGLYEDDKRVNPYLLAPAILSPSYLSFDFALSYYGLIPERVVAITSASMNVRKNKTFINEFGRFEYSDVPASVFSRGVILFEENGYFVRIASKEKAICDSLAKWRTVNSVKELKYLLFVDKRFDEDEFATCDFMSMIEIASLYKKTNLNLLIKLIRKEYVHEQLN